MKPGSHAAGDGSFERSAGIQAGRAALLIAVAVIIGFVLLHRSPSSAIPVVTAPTTSTTPRTTPLGSTGTSLPGIGGVTSTTGATRPPASVKVLVANGTTTSGAAGRVSTQVHAKGYQTLTPVDSTQHPASTMVYFSPGYGSDAAALAGKLGVAGSSVSAMPQPPPVANLSKADILVVVGPDLAGATSAGTTSIT